MAEASLLEWTVENGGKRIKTKTMTANIAGACFCSLRIEFSQRFSVPDSRKHIKMVVWTRIDRWKRILLKTHSCGQGLRLRSNKFTWTYRHVYVTIGLATSFIYSFTVISLSLYSSLIFQFLSFFQGTAHRVTELLASRLGRDKVILNHPVASIKQVTIKVTVTVLGRHDLLLLMS